MATASGSRFTIAQTMIAIAVVGLVLALGLTPGFAPVLGVVVIPSTVVGIATFLAARRLIELCYGHRCPGCGVRGLERRAIQSFGERFFLCRQCGVRCRRSLLGTHGMFFWRDASGPEYAPLYAKPQESDPWNAPPNLEDEGEYGVYSKTHLDLVRNKRRRTPENPNGPGLG